MSKPLHLQLAEHDARNLANAKRILAQPEKETPFSLDWARRVLERLEGKK